MVNGFHLRPRSVTQRVTDVDNKHLRFYYIHGIDEKNLVLHKNLLTF